MKRKFYIGSEWLYLKIYTDEIHSDDILTRVVLPSFYSLKRDKFIEEFFFIRYFDPDFHIRIRFKLTDSVYCFDIIKIINLKVKKFIKNGYVWNITLDSYERELDLK